MTDCRAIRPGTAADVEAIARVHVAAWRRAYHAIVPAAYLDGLSEDDRARSWREVFESGSTHVLVAEDRSDAARPKVIGFAAFGPSRDRDAAPSTGEVYAIYVYPPAWSTGAGRELWLDARQLLIADGYTQATLWVLARNDRAIRFYRRAGFEHERHADTTIEIGGAMLDEVRLATTLESAVETGRLQDPKRPATRGAVSDD